MHADTSIFAILGELGLVGAIPFCLLFILLFYYSYRLRRDVAYVIPDEQSNILGTIPFYIMCFLFIINFISGNNWISIYFMPMSDLLYRF
jgi:O-antigen ligase